MKTFNLIDEPWILVLDEGLVREVSIREALERSHRLSAVVGDVPTQAVAILRLLMVIVKRSLPPIHDDEAATELWLELFDAERLPVEAIGQYLDLHHERFDLRHPTDPFYQVAALEAGSTSGLVKLIADMPDGNPFFTNRRMADSSRLTAREGARWLVHAQAFDPSGIKTGAIGDSRVKGGKGYPIGTGWGGRCGLIVVEGVSLKETLLLNLPLEPDTASDRPAWERPALTAEIEQGHPNPLGWCDIATWQSRRARLLWDGDSVSDVIIANGDPIQRYNQHEVETMTAWRYSEPQTKKIGQTAYMPLEHVPDRTVWRGLEPMLVAKGGGGTVKGTSTDLRLRPRSLDWLASVGQRGRIVSIRTVSAIYGPQDSTFATIVDDAMPINLDALSDSTVRARVIDAVGHADDVARAFADLVKDLATATGERIDDGLDPRLVDARHQVYDAVDAEFRGWLLSVNADADMNERAITWQRVLSSVAHRLGEQAVADAGSSSFLGRTSGTGSKVNSAIAHRWYFGKVAKALPLARPSSKPTAENLKEELV